MDLIEVVKDFGPAIGIVLFFLGRDAAREERMAKEIAKLNHFIQSELIELVKKHGTNPQPKLTENDQGGDVSPEA
jgi:hypothetical protein